MMCGARVPLLLLWSLIHWLEAYVEKESRLDLRVRQTKANFAPKIEPFGVSFTFEAKRVSIETLADTEMVDEERVPVREIILAALLVESRTLPELVRLTRASEGTVYNNLANLVLDGLFFELRPNGVLGSSPSSSPTHRAVCLLAGVASSERGSDPPIERSKMMPGAIAVKLRILREERGLTQKEAAQLAQVHLDTLRHLESGERPPYMPTLTKIARAYGVSIEEVVEG